MSQDMSGDASGDMNVRLDGEEYVIRRDGDDVRVGRKVGGDVAWLDTVDAELFTAPAREALQRGDSTDEALLTALRGIVAAEVERGG